VFLVGSVLLLFLVFCVVICLSSSCVLCAIGKSVSGLSILDCPFGFH
jgi:hypothetical protein